MYPADKGFAHFTGAVLDLGYIDTGLQPLDIVVGQVIGAFR